MRWGIFLLTVVSLCAVGIAASAGEPVLALISTEVDDGLDGAGTFMDREVLSIYPPNFSWSYDVNDVFFDPADVLGIETGLDAFDIGAPLNANPDGLRLVNGGSLYYFSTEVDFEYQGQFYTDEDLLVYDPVLGVLARAWDSKTAFGGVDLGYDATCWFYDEVDAKWLLIFSTEVGGTAMIDGTLTTFTGGDVLVTDGTELVGWLDMTAVFGREVGLDAIHVWLQDNGPNDISLNVIFSTEVDGVVREIDGVPGDADPLVPFKDEDLLSFGFAFAEGPGAIIHSEVAWRGVENGFGKDVGLDAVYLEFEPIPEPGVMLIVGLGLVVPWLRSRRKK